MGSVVIEYCEYWYIYDQFTEEFIVKSMYICMYVCMYVCSICEMFFRNVFLSLKQDLPICRHDFKFSQ
jgi:hypothetical protein